MRYMEEMFAQIAVTEDIPFAQTADACGRQQTLHMDVYAPAQDSDRRRRVLFLLHGGGFSMGQDKRQRSIVLLAHWFARRGYVVVSPDYTLYPPSIPKPDYRQCAQRAAGECELARQYLLAHGEAFGIDPGTVAVAGTSAGGMAANVWCRQPGAFCAFINFWGSLADPPQAEGYPPTFIVHGTEDASVSFSFSQGLLERLRAAGVRCQLLPVEGAGHTPMREMDSYMPRALAFLDQCFTGQSE